MAEKFSLGKNRLTPSIALDIARGKTNPTIAFETRKRMEKSFNAVAEIAAGNTPVYGINTGFGPLCTTGISTEQTRKLQENILKSHSTGMGEPIPKEIAKLMLILKVHALAMGYSGIALETVNRIMWHIENNIIPVVPSQGSVGASGDLAPLAHLFLPLIGRGKVIYRGKETDSSIVLQKENLKPLDLGPKEGLALINGTQFITAFAVKVLDRLHNCLTHADIAGAMMVDGLLGSIKPFRHELHELRPYKGSVFVASRMMSLLKNSGLVASHINCGRVQDPYSLRCIPQVHGASRNAWLHLRELVETELNSVTDNPVIFNSKLTISGGNFHGQPLAMPLDYACLAAAELGNISDRRIYLSLHGIKNSVPKLLMKETGINSGFMIPQYTTAALVSENKGLCFPASADSIPTSLGQEDHVSMGSISGRKTVQVIENLEKILGIELMVAAQVIDFHHPLKPGTILNEIHAEIRKNVSHLESDVVMADEMNKTVDLLRNGRLSNMVREQEKLYEEKLPGYELFEVY